MLSDTLTAVAVLTDSAELRREVTGVIGDPDVDKCDTTDDVFGDPELLESDFVMKP